MLGLAYGCDDFSNPFVDYYEKAKQAKESGDLEAAIKWFTKAAEQGLAEAQHNLASMYDSGEGVAQDYKQAVYWYTKAAEQGYASAQSDLGILYHYGNGVPEDIVKAHMWINISAGNGLAIGKANKEFIERRMSPSQIEKAQEMARECVAKNYKGC